MTRAETLARASKRAMLRLSLTAAQQKALEREAKHAPEARAKRKLAHLKAAEEAKAKGAA